ncbi:dynein axonemal intermediate chain 4 isoform X2 [Ahaetulla prasina]|uniref:dynein axonemal intermediate chain 4 isoform X2 n=2 Tax=Ahaetulla prasina TaxID=499056 RepID=UPI002648CBE7|nr:dynein axonemal intermediate chain 4 isoform X2 [Ahaetulla prasina]
MSTLYKTAAQPTRPDGLGSLTKEQNVYKKLPSTSASGRRLSFASTMQGSKIGSMGRRSIVITSEPKMEKGALPSSKPLVQVFDDQGKDVTPRPLYHPELNVAHRQSKILSVHDFAGVTQPDFLSSLSMQQTSVASISLAGPFSRTYGSGSVTKSTASTESMAEEIVEPGFRRDTISSFTDVQVRREEMLEQLTKHDLEKVVDILLTETETIWLFNMPTDMISSEAEEAEDARKRNIAYMELCKNRLGNDQYANRMMQTLNGAPKTKEVQCDKIVMADKEIMATTWDLFDSFNALEEATAETSSGALTTVAGKPAAVKERDKAMPLGSMETESFTSSSIIDLESVILSRIQEETEDHSEIIFKSDKFNQDLFYMERVLMENIFQPKLAAYRQLPILIEPDAKSDYSESEFDNISIKEEEKEEEERAEEEQTSMKSSLLLEFGERQEELPPPFMEALWSYGCSLTKGNNVSCMAWNKFNPDLLAVGYGQFRFQEQKKGLACCWSLKNPMWPERIYNCIHGVTALDFSTANPNLLAVGLFNGTIEVYNVQSRNQTSVLDNSESHDKHLGPVWQLRWVEQDRGTSGEDKGEILVSISADGRITKWFVRKGLSCSDLMKLKRTTAEKKKTGTERKSEALISRQAPGLCFDFHPKDTNIYMAGTEEGYIHKCSCSYNEQYLETYRGHKGPVYKITWNPFSTEVFLSCSADWTIMLWRQDSVRPVLIFTSTTNVIYDIMWSPRSAYVFAAVNETRVEIWDLSVSTLDPLIVNPATGNLKFTTVLFAKSADCLLIGDSDGLVTVYALRNMTVSDKKKRRGSTASFYKHFKLFTSWVVVFSFLI